MEVIWDTVADCINGDGMVRSLSVTNVKTGAKTDLDVQGVFIAVGISPESKAFEGIVDMDHGYIRPVRRGDLCSGHLCGRGCADQAPSPDHYGSSGRRQCSYQRGTVPDRELGGCRANEEVEENTGCQRSVQLCVCSACPGIHQSGDRFFLAGISVALNNFYAATRSLKSSWRPSIRHGNRSAKNQGSGSGGNKGASSGKGSASSDSGTGTDAQTEAPPKETKATKPKSSHTIILLSPRSMGP